MPAPGAAGGRQRAGGAHTAHRPWLRERLKADNGRPAAARHARFLSKRKTRPLTRLDRWTNSTAGPETLAPVGPCFRPGVSPQPRHISCRYVEQDAGETREEGPGRGDRAGRRRAGSGELFAGAHWSISWPGSASCSAKAGGLSRRSWKDSSAGRDVRSAAARKGGGEISRAKVVGGG
jgi:hypothetical protein